MKKEYCVYKHTTPNGKIYIGQTCREPNIRWSNGNGYRHQVFFNAIQKYGWDNIKHEIVASGLSKEEANQKEIELISYYDSTNPEKGYNIALGGTSTLGVKCSEETKQKISKARKGQKHSKEIIQKIIESRKGYSHSKETREKIGEANRKRIWSDESKEKLKRANIGKKLSEEHKQKIGDYFRLYSPNKKPVVCVETNVVYESLNDAERKTGILRRGIGMVCSGDRPTAGGYHWCFLDEYNKNTYVLREPKTSNKPNKVVCLETGIVYNSFGDAERQTGTNRIGIGKVCKKERKTAGGYHWMFYDEYLKSN